MEVIQIAFSMERINWDDIYMTMTYLVAMKSEDPASKLGAIIVDEDNVLVSSGYNGLPRGIQVTPERLERPEKYFWFEHAERNAIYNALRLNHSVRNAKMYTNGLPCMDCGRAIIQTGIKEVIFDNRWDIKQSDLWKENCGRTGHMFRERGINFRPYNGHFVVPVRFHNGIEEKLK